MKHSLIIFFLYYYSTLAIGQDFKKVNISYEDNLKGVILKYRWVGGESNIDFVLKKNQTYEYVFHNHSYRISEGKWVKKQHNIFFTSFIQYDNLPIGIRYGTNAYFKDSSKIAILTDLNNERLSSDIYINDNYTKFDPFLGIGDKLPANIYRVKVVLQNGISSKWMAVEKPSDKIILTVLTRKPVLQYIVMKDEKFKITGNHLKNSRLKNGKFVFPFDSLP